MAQQVLPMELILTGTVVIQFVALRFKKTYVKI